jgi:KaiC/GvpD/RAD55 family RecA-like ATPase
MKVKSGISQAHWCEINGGIAEFTPASIGFGPQPKENISWFDKLFEGGLDLPDTDKVNPHPLTMLVTGPPGTGKTTLISELCYRLAKNEQGNPVSLFSLYISTDSTTGQFIGNTKNLGWKDANIYFEPFSRKGQPPRGRAQPHSVVLVWGKNEFRPDNQKWETISELVTTSISSLQKWILKAESEKLISRLGVLIENTPMRGGTRTVTPDILVVDNLNIVDTKKQGEHFQEFLKTCRARKLVIFVLDSGSASQEHKFWEYFCDIVIRLDNNYIQDYYVRTIEVVKARYQAHFWGRHQLKIYANPKSDDKPSTADPTSPELQQYNLAKRRSHPYMGTGGIFIYPSIHSYLSTYKRLSASNPLEPCETYPSKLNEILTVTSQEGETKGGIPKGRCTAFIGPRGGHKSHLGYAHLLHRLRTSKQEGALVVSLREDEGVTKDTLGHIMQQEFGREDKIDQYENDNRLEVLYFAPGYITPEEFFHRIFISIHRLKKRNKDITVLFNSLDQLSARFPLCAKQEIFIPGIIQSLSAENITSICIAVNEPGQPGEQYGLLPMADLILSFSRRKFPINDYVSHINEMWKSDRKVISKIRQLGASQSSATCHETVVLEVVRLAGGKRGGARGILELVNQDELQEFLYARPGLHFTPLSDKFSQGELIKDV